MTDEQLAALREACDWLRFATFDRIYKSQEEYDAMMDRLEAAIEALAKEVA